MTPYEELETRFRDLSHLGHAGAILHWDEASMMPTGGGEARGQSMALLAAIAHQRLTHPEIGAFLDQAESKNGQLCDPITALAPSSSLTAGCSVIARSGTWLIILATSRSKPPSGDPG